jgi:plastocyanin
MRHQRLTSICAALLLLTAQPRSRAEITEKRADVTAHLEEVHYAHTAKDSHKQIPPAALWLEPIHGDTQTFAATPHRRYIMMQKNKMFTPHLLIVPVGSVVLFPNKDPFFHNVFSLFDGKRFDLGLYEAGSTRAVTFSRKGVSYIFCNIHPEMSAVVLALATPYYGIADARGVFHLHDVPPGEYELHIWIEAEPQSLLDRLTKQVKISSDSTNLGEIQFETAPQLTGKHLNKFGQPYHPDESPIY